MSKGCYPARLYPSRRPPALLRFRGGRTPRISCEAVPAPIQARAGMRRHVHSGNHSAESYVSFIPLLSCFLAPARACSCVGCAALLRRTTRDRDQELPTLRQPGDSERQGATARHRSGRCSTLARRRMLDARRRGPRPPDRPRCPCRRGQRPSLPRTGAGW